MGATEETFAALAERAGFSLVRALSIEGLTGRGHAEPALAPFVPSSTVAALASIHAALGGDADMLSAKRSAPLRMDFVDMDRRLVIEVDEIQHFTTDRRNALELYPSDAKAGRQDYVPLLSSWCGAADRYRAKKPAADFPFAGGRRAQRACLDAVRDLVLPALGYTLIRVPAPECDGRLAFARFLELMPGGT